MTGAGWARWLAPLAVIVAGGAAAENDPAPVATPTYTSIPLWPNGAPGVGTARAKEPEVGRDYWVRHVENPSLLVFPADAKHNSGAAVVVFPGGGHRLLVWTSEGVKVAAALKRIGVTTFVLKYRLAREAGSSYSIEGDAADDARRAVRWVRAHAGDYGIDPKRVGVMGFSAGGELVSMIADNPEPAGRPRTDAIDALSARPDFQVLIFPGPLGIPGKDAAHAPPAFIAAGTIDVCCAAPSVALYEQLRAAHVSAELHMFADTDHAFNLDETNRQGVTHWPDELAWWLADGGWLDGGR